MLSLSQVNVSAVGKFESSAKGVAKSRVLSKLFTQRGKVIIRHPVGFKVQLTGGY